MTEKIHVVITGANGFIGKNLCLRLSELEEYIVTPLARGCDHSEFVRVVGNADILIHLAGVNRPSDPADFARNYQDIEVLTAAIDISGNKALVIYASSTSAADESQYGRSKKIAEETLCTFADKSGCPVAILRLPNVFGKWCKPNYNSAVATFCHNIARNLPISVNDPSSPLSLLYIDDLVDQIIDLVSSADGGSNFTEIKNVYQTTVGEVADLIYKFHSQRHEAHIENVGVGLCRALYATYISYLPPESFSYDLVSHSDPRGSFSEMLRTKEAGQFSYFNAYPGVTRGGHYHHSKTEKFLVVHGEALFRFRHMLTGEVHSLRTSSHKPTVVDTIPGWSHDITNVGDDVMVCLLWANELFDRMRPDTIQAEV